MAKTFDCDEEEVSNDEEMVQVKVLMALADDALVVGKNHVRNGEWIDIIMRKEQLEEEKHVNEKWLSSSSKVSHSINEKISNQKKKILGINQLTETLSKKDVIENGFICASMGYD
nr:hypothetical protein [Tanacetum cinerariifolium]